MSIVDVEVSEGHADPRLDMTEKSLDGTVEHSAASYLSVNEIAVSEK